MPKSLSLPVFSPRSQDRRSLVGEAVGDGEARASQLAALLRESEKKEKCGIFGIWGPDAVRRTYLGLYAQQHRGQESAGIAVATSPHAPGGGGGGRGGGRLEGISGMGLVPEIFDDEAIARLEGRRVGRLGQGQEVPPRGAIGHTRYSTSGGSLSCNAQPLIESYIGGQVAIGHNGNLINAVVLREKFEQAGHIFHTTSDTEVIIHLLASPEQQKTPDPVAATLRRLQGAFSLVFLFPDRVEAARDPWGWRPLVIGKVSEEDGGGYVAASETVALDVLGAKLVREVEPGEIVTLCDPTPECPEGFASRRFATPADRPAHCAFEHVYFANPASVVFGQNVQQVRETLGEQLAREAPVAADYVMPMPDSGRSAAHGYSRASGIEYREGIVPNRYVGRTFIKPTQDQRNAAVRLKLNVIGEIVRGKRLIVVDDSIVRGTTTRAKMEQLRTAGAKEIHLRISCPPIRHPCFFGVDFAEPSQLIAHGKSVEEIRRFLGVDSLHYLSLEGMLSCMERPVAQYCTACWSGDYRIDLEHPITDVVAEREQLPMFR